MSVLVARLQQSVVLVALLYLWRLKTANWAQVQFPGIVFDTNTFPLSTPALSESANPTLQFRGWTARLVSRFDLPVDILALLYIWRFKTADVRQHVERHAEYPLFAVAMMLASKFVIDRQRISDTAWADMSDMIEGLQITERAFLDRIGYHLFCSPEELDSWHLTLGQLGTYAYNAYTAWYTTVNLTSTVILPPAFPFPSYPSQGPPQSTDGAGPSQPVPGRTTSSLLCTSPSATSKSYCVCRILLRES
ncbi:hypothetical protein IWZ01DRAFT_360797 [Phyllosticta capitalensis]